MGKMGKKRERLRRTAQEKLDAELGADLADFAFSFRAKVCPRCRSREAIARNMGNIERRFKNVELDVKKLGEAIHNPPRDGRRRITLDKNEEV